MRKFFILSGACLFLHAFVSTAQVATPSALDTALATNSQGTTVSLSGVDPLSCPQISMTQTANGGKLIFSDSPESSTVRGILYQDTSLAATPVGVTNRIFVYHVNSNLTQMRFSVLIKNNGSLSGTLTVPRFGSGGPSTDYPTVGQTAFSSWLASSPKNNVTVTPGQIVRLDTTFDTMNVNKNFLVNGIWDYTFNQPHTVIICMLNPSDNPIVTGPTLAVLPRDSHVRGTFPSCNKTYVSVTNVFVDTAGGIKQFPVAGNGDTFVTGVNNAVGSPTTETNTGNYGVLYNIQLALTSTDGRAMGWLANPRGGAWEGAVNMLPGLFPGGAFTVPAEGGTLADNTMAVILGGYNPGSGTNIPMQFMPTGGSSFPIRMLTVPYNSSNSTPTLTLAAINNFTVNAGQTVSFTAVATDSNTNATLTFSLSSTPAGATIGAANGTFHWRLPVASAGTSTNLQVVVTDNSLPPQTANRTFTITVNPVTRPTVASTSIVGGQFQLQASGMIGPDYILQANSSVTNPGGWVNVATNTPGSSPFTLTDPGSAASSRFYRLRLGP